MELIIIRHGQSVADITDRHEGRADFPLTDLGRSQAAQLATWVAREMPPELIWSSPLVRAAETARLVADKTGATLVLRDELMELNNGVLAGLPRAEARVKYPSPPGGRKYYQRIEQGESEIEFRTRVESALAELLDTHAERRRVAIIAHGGTITMLFRAFVGLPLSTNVWLPTADTGVHRWEVTAQTRRILLANSTVHLTL